MTMPWWFRPLGRVLAVCGQVKRWLQAPGTIEPMALVAAMTPRCAMAAG